MCGIVGLVAAAPVNQTLFDALTALQHRGQDAAGMATSSEGRIVLHRGNGLVRDVFRLGDMLELTGHLGLGHVRYPTAGGYSLAEAQPFYVNSPYGITLVHNGNLINAAALREQLWRDDLRHINTGSDTEVLLNVFAHALTPQPRSDRGIDYPDVFHAVSEVHRRCVGAYAVVAMIAGYGLVGFRDPNGIRPVIYGKREMAGKTAYMIASESAALSACGFDVVADIAPGEAIYITEAGEIHRQQCAKNPAYHPCIFEYVYLARQDSFIDDISVYRVRRRLGAALAAKIQRERPDLEVDVVMPIPDTSRPAAMELAAALDLKYSEGFVKNRYIGRTFIMPGQTQRQKSVRQKLNTLDIEFKDKAVLLVDDSIVRGTTCREIIQMAREAQAKKVYFASAAPLIRYPNVYGIDMPSHTELIAYGNSVETICQEIGADWLVFQDLDDLIACATASNPQITAFEDSVFTGHYVTGDIDPDYLNKLAQARGAKPS